MRFKAPLLRSLSVSILLVAGALTAAQSQTNDQPQANPAFENCLREQVANEQPINLEAACSKTGDAVIGTAVLYELLTRPPEAKHGALAGIWISKATIVGDLFLTYRNISYDLQFENCHFLGKVAFNDTRFEKNFSLAGSTFDNQVDFSRMEVVRDFEGTGCHFNFKATGPNSFGANFTNVHARNLNLDNAHFPGGVFLYDMNISGNVDLERLEVNGPFVLSRTIIKGNLVLINANILGNVPKDFSVTTTDNLVFSNNVIQPPYTLNGLTFRLLFAAPDEMMNFVEAGDYRPVYNDFYQNLENFYRQRESLVHAKAVHVAWKKRERTALLASSSFWDKVRYLLNWIHYVTTGYGQYVELALVWSIGFIVVGYFVFRKREWMEATTPDDVWPLRYHPWWYSIALFLPVVSLHDKNNWTPKADRKKSRIYMRLHIILGYLLIPIGLAAWTGLIK